MTTTRKLETTPAQAAQAVAIFTPMELAMTMEARLMLDAVHAHELLALVEQLHKALVDIVSPMASGGAAPCQASMMRDPSECVCGKCRKDRRRAALDAAAPWLEV